jgi:hypothetical protein
MDRTVLDGLGTSLETEDETTCVITEHNPDKTSPQVEKIDNAISLPNEVRITDGTKIQTKLH